VNPVLLAPAGTVTVPGTVTLVLLSDTVTANPPPGAAPLSVTVQEDDPGALTLPGAQERLFNVTGGGGWFTVIVPPVPEAGIEVPPPFVAEMLLSVTGTLVLDVPEAIVKANVATVPFPIVVVLNPTTRHVAVPLP
jgi:hypothetical protein